jgi:hypothetical protein
MVAIAVTGGWVLKWMCAGFLAQSGFRTYWLHQRELERTVACMVPGRERESRLQYQQIMNEYLEGR